MVVHAGEPEHALHDLRPGHDREVEPVLTRSGVPADHQSQARRIHEGELPHVEDQAVLAGAASGSELLVETRRGVEVELAGRACPPVIAVAAGLAAEGLGWLKRCVGLGHWRAPLAAAAVYPSDRNPGTYGQMRDR